ncbi:CAP domain-containing protein [Actinacidiphila reveromycinica]|uniref:CAP domain-containing protein n=1 Tax=Actinacidiphila reveromycinica TaxID=659352 RepID=UPI001F223566|nr:CAP domain-containing protein [Streptomyces sp. SN-593]
MRTGLLASSAALAVGAVAASSGLLSDLDGQLHHLDGDGGLNQADGAGPTGDGAPSSLLDTNTPSSDGTTAPAPGSTTASTPARTPATTARGATPSHPATTKAAAPTPTRTTAAPTTPVTTLAPRTTAPTATVPAAGGAVASARAEILGLVNEQRATAGCQPLTASSSLDTLAQDFSDDMAARGFFSHTDPDGNDPWARAAKLGISNLGGENIAMGQADAQAVMTAWMNSPGHRANILNCDYKTLGVGAHFGTGGPWWTQDFGY